MRVAHDSNPRPGRRGWVAQRSMFLGIDEKEVGRIGGGKRKVNVWRMSR